MRSHKWRYENTCIIKRRGYRGLGGGGDKGTVKVVDKQCASYFC